MKISNFTQGRNNNFNVIRITAAFAVLITHSFALALGSSSAEPFREKLGMTMGSIAVDVFFITSGFLITGSLFTRKSAIEFIWARCLRIFPAMLVMVLLTVFGLGAYFSTIPLVSYLTDSKTILYLLKCSTLIAGVTFDLPAVFNNNPLKNAVNGSLWTMPYELRMYAILCFVWIALHMAKSNRPRIFEITIVSAACVAGVIIMTKHFSLGMEWHFARLFFMFFSGAAFYVLKERITLSHSYFWLFIVALIVSAIVNKHAFFLVYSLTITYILVYLAYIPSGYVRSYNHVGDYSYGVYIYAFPVQQSIAALIHGVSVLTMILISSAVTLFFAVFSWHFLEKRALGLKGIYIDHTYRILGNKLTK